MYQGKHTAAYIRRSREHSSHKRVSALVVSVLLMFALVIPGTIAYLVSSTDAVTNKFTPAHVSCEVTEQFNGTVKSDVNVKNTGDIDAYVRVKLITYRVNENGQRIGGSAEIPAFTPGNGWVHYKEYYYYTEPVPQNESPASDLIERIELIGSYDDADGGKQAIDVMAEAIQSAPTEAVGSSWGVMISSGTVRAYE